MSLNKAIVSVIVITYNSSITIKETLDSIVIQTYGPENLDLIICDDGSHDKTIDIIDSWLTEHHNLFYKVTKLYNIVNMGVSANCNNGWKNAKGAWLKTIAGDDILYPDCISNNIMYTSTIDKRIGVIFSCMEQFYTDHDGQHVTFSFLPPRFQQKILSTGNNLKQYKYIQTGDITAAPSALIRNEALIDINFADERFTLIEDYPVWCKLLSKGWSFAFMNIVTVKYRISNSITNNSDKLSNVDYILQMKMAHELYHNSNMSMFDFGYRKRIWFFLVLFIIKIFDNKKTRLSFFIYKLSSLFRPYYLSNVFERISNKFIKKK